MDSMRILAILVLLLCVDIVCARRPDVYDSCTHEDEAEWYASLGQADAEIALRTRMLTSDPQTLYNLTAALWDAGYDCEAWFREVLSRANPIDETNIYVLDMLAEAVYERGDYEQAAAIRAHAEYLAERRDQWHCSERKPPAYVDVAPRSPSR